MERGDKQRLERSQIGQALVLFQAADLRFAVADRDGKLELRELFTAAQEFQIFAKGSGRSDRWGQNGHVPP